MTAFLLLSIIGKALEIRKFMAMSDLPARDNKEHWAVKEREGKIPHTERRRRGERSGAHTAPAELPLSLLNPSLLEPSTPLTSQPPPRRTDEPLHLSFPGIRLQIFWFKVDEASCRSGFTPHPHNPIPLGKQPRSVVFTLL